MLLGDGFVFLAVRAALKTKKNHFEGSELYPKNASLPALQQVIRTYNCRLPQKMIISAGGAETLNAGSPVQLPWLDAEWRRFVGTLRQFGVEQVSVVLQPELSALPLRRLLNEVIVAASQLTPDWRYEIVDLNGLSTLGPATWLEDHVSYRFQACRYFSMFFDEYVSDPTIVERVITAVQRGAPQVVIEPMMDFIERMLNESPPTLDQRSDNLPPINEEPEIEEVDADSASILSTEDISDLFIAEQIVFSSDGVQQPPADSIQNPEPPFATVQAANSPSSAPETEPEPMDQESTAVSAQPADVEMQ